MPDIKHTNPRDQFLKPGFEKSCPFEEKVDRDLDKQILQSGVKSLPSFSEEATTFQPDQQLTFRSIVKKSVTLPNGTVETEEVVRNSDGTEQRTVTQTLPDGSSKITPALDSSGQLSSRELEVKIRGPTSFTLKGIKDLIDIIFK